MPYCSRCSHLMDKKTTSTDVYFICELCTNKLHGTAEDTLMFSEFKVDDSNEMFNVFKKHAVVDPCNAKLDIPCEQCTMPYMTMIRIGEQDRARLLCICGFEKLYE